MKFEYIVPIYCWPTKVFFVDDDASFLNITSKILSKNFSIESNTEPEMAIKIINEQIELPYPQHFSKQYEDEDNESITIVKEDISKIKNKIKDNKRHDLISTIIMDYNLPRDTGINYIKQLENHNVQKILLTGYAKPQQVIDAFNEKCIDKYIGKYDYNATETLVDEINRAQASFFEILTKNLINKKTELYNLLSNKYYINIFNKLINKNKIEEFYLLDQYGSFLLFTQDAKKLLFVCTTTDYIDELKLFFESNVPSVQNLIKDIGNYKKIPFFYGLEYPPEVKNWEKYCFNCQKIQNTNLLFSLVTNTSMYKF